MNFNLNKSVLFQYIKIILYITLSGFILYISNNIVYDIVAFVILVLGAVYTVRFDLAHPYVWYSIVFMFYSISYPILYLLGDLNAVFPYTKSLMFSQWLALSIFLIVVTPIKTDYSKLKQNKSIMVTSKIFLLFTSLIVFFTIYEISTGGYTHKTEIYSGGSILTLIGFRAVLVLLILFTINLSIYSLNKNKLDIRMSIFVLSIVFLMVFFSGERDLLIRFFVSVLFIYYVLIKNSKLNINVILLGAFSLALIPILKKYKYFGLTGETAETNSNIFIDFLQSDFISASRNLQVLLLDESSNGIFNGSTFVSAFLRMLNLENIPWVNVISANSWYNQTYFPNRTAGQGFTIVGDGYINFGYVGIIILFVFIGIIVRVLYSLSNRSANYFSFYILSIPIFLYSIRADLANILLPLFKQNLITFLLLHLLISILYSNKTGKLEFKDYQSSLK